MSRGVQVVPEQHAPRLCPEYLHMYPHIYTCIQIYLQLHIYISTSGFTRYLWARHSTRPPARDRRRQEWVCSRRRCPEGCRWCRLDIIDIVDIDQIYLCRETAAGPQGGSSGPVIAHRPVCQTRPGIFCLSVVQNIEQKLDFLIST